MTLAEQLRRRAEEMEALSDPVQPKSTLAWQVYAQTLLAKAATDNVSAADEIERLEKALETAREALEPFGPLARVILSEAPPEATYTSLFLDCQGISHRITLYALRDVQRALSQKKEG